MTRSFLLDRLNLCKTRLVACGLVTRSQQGLPTLIRVVGLVTQSCLNAATVSWLNSGDPVLYYRHYKKLRLVSCVGSFVGVSQFRWVWWL